MSRFPIDAEFAPLYKLFVTVDLIHDKDIVTRTTVSFGKQRNPYLRILRVSLRNMM